MSALAFDPWAVPKRKWEDAPLLKWLILLIRSRTTPPG
jgi:hypothetical protein